MKSKSELDLIRKSGLITATALKKLIENAKAGTSLLGLERIAHQTVLSLGGKPSFTTVPGYKWTTCLTLNNEVVHGIPRDISLKEGDILSVDLGTVYQGWHTDAAWSILISGQAGDRVQEKKRFLKVGEEALWKGINQATEGNRIGDISEAIQTTVEQSGYCVVRTLVGHGVGRKLHEDPEVPGFGKKGTGIVLSSGMTLAIEAIYTEGGPDVVLENDGWTISTQDGSLGGLFEMSVIVGRDKAEVLTDWREANL